MVDETVKAPDAIELTEQEKDLIIVRPFVLAYRELRDKMKALKTEQDSCKEIILGYVKLYGDFVLEGGKSMMKTRRGSTVYDPAALDVLTTAWMDGNKTEQKYARLILEHRTVKPDTTYLEVK